MVAAGRVVLIVDQLEEAFTLCQDESEREAFFGRLGEMARLPGDAPGNVTALVVLGLRADFYGQATRYPLLRDVLRDAPVLLDPMSEAELRQAIIFPARAVGLEVEPGLVEVLLRDLGVARQDDRAGRLPLLAHALRATWQQRRGHRLTVDGYRATGGIERAIATTADRAYDGLDVTAREEARILFLRLVVIGEGGSDTRRRLSRAELLRDFDAGPVRRARRVHPAPAAHPGTGHGHDHARGPGVRLAPAARVDRFRSHRQRPAAGSRRRREQLGR